jgi:hypothetical protein
MNLTRRSVLGLLAAAPVVAAIPASKAKAETATIYADSSVPFLKEYELPAWVKDPNGHVAVAPFQHMEVAPIINIDELNEAYLKTRNNPMILSTLKNGYLIGRS